MLAVLIATAARGDDVAVTAELPELRVGMSIAAEIGPESDVLSDVGPTSTPDLPTRAARFALEVDQPGAVTIDLRSYLFDAYLALEGAGGELIAEDDDGLAGKQARLVIDLAPGRYVVVACALRGVTGPFTLDIRDGAAPSPSPEARREADLAEARRTVEVRERTLGSDHPSTADALTDVATLHYVLGQYAEAEPLLRRALSIDESALGPDHPKTATALSNLGEVCRVLGRLPEAEALQRRGLEIRERVLGSEDASVAESLNNLGLVYSLQARFSEALPLAERALKIQQETLGPEHPGTSVGLNNLAALYRSLGRYDEAVPIMQRAVAIREASVGPDHPETAISLDNLAGLYRALGRVDEAEPLLRRALTIRERSLGSASVDTAFSLNNLASLLERRGLPADAEPLYRRALTIFEATLGPDHPNTALCLDNIALVCRQQGRLSEAAPLYARTSEIRERVLGPDHPDTAWGLHKLASLHIMQGRYGEAESLYRRVLAVFENSFGLDHTNVALALNSLGVLYEIEGRYESAAPLFSRAATILEKALGADHIDTAAIVNNLASVLETQGRFEEAEVLYRKALAVVEERGGPDHPLAASVLNGLSVLCREQGRFEEAEPLMRRALAIRESRLGSMHPETANMIRNLATWHHAQGRYDDAEPLYRRVLEILSTTLGPDHPHTARSRSDLALLCDTQGRFAEALPNTLQALDGGAAWVLRELLRVSSDRRFSVAGTQRNYVDEALSEWRAQSDPSSLDAVYRRVCAWKGVVFRHVARLSRTLSVTAERDERVRALREELIDVDGQLSTLAYAERITDPDDHQRRLDALRGRRADIQRRVLTQLGIEPERESTDGAELSRLLPLGAAVLDFLIHRPLRVAATALDGGPGDETWLPARVLCFISVAGASAPRVVDLGDARHLRSVTAAWLDGIAAGRRGFAPSTDAGPPPGDAVREFLLDPILAELPSDVTSLLIIPDGFLGSVPYGAIPLGEGRYVLEAVDVTYATDPVTLRDLLGSKPASSGAAPSILAVGGVDYDVDEADESTRPGETSSRGVDRGFTRDFGPLPGTAEEVDALRVQVARAFPDAAPPLVLKGGDASERAVKTEAPGHSILHFATHGFFERRGLVSRWEQALERAYADDQPRGFGALASPSNPWRGRDPFAGMRPLEGEEPGLLAGLVLAGANVGGKDDRDDGVLTATEVAALDLSACRLAVLSACQSSLGVDRSGEGMQSLRRAFQEAGAQTVVASLWKVDDAATRRLMTAFYRELWNRDRGAGDALRRARLALLREEGDPYYWAGFTLSGEWR